MEGEHRSMTEIDFYMPEFVPKPITWGRFKKDSPKTFFYLMEYVELGPRVLKPPDFCRLLAQLHTLIIYPTGQFGFHQVTFQGPNPQNTTWASNWCTYFTRLLTEWLDREIPLNGPRPEYEATYKDFIQRTIPQILEPLQSDGRSLSLASYTGTCGKKIPVLTLRLECLLLSSTLAPCTHIMSWNWACGATVIIGLESHTSVNISTICLRANLLSNSMIATVCML